MTGNSLIDGIGDFLNISTTCTRYHSRFKILCMKNAGTLFSSRFIIIFMLAGSLTVRTQQAQETISMNSYLEDMPFSMPDISLPSFVDNTYNITEFGASGDGQNLNTDAFEKAIEACHAAGGGKVIVPPGIWLTGPIRFKSNVNLHVEKGALILFSHNHKDYPIIQKIIDTID